MAALVPYLAALGLSAGLLVLGAAWGGWWAAAALGWMAALVAALDHLLPEHDVPPSARGARALTVALGMAHPPLLAVAVWALATTPMGWGWAAFYGAAGLFFVQVMNSAAHELIHASGRWRRALGRWVYVTLLFGHQATAHPGIHHVAVATPDDPNTARRGESWWRFCPRAWHGSFWRGLSLEKARQRRVGRRGWDRRNPYWQYLGGAAAAMALAWGLGGGRGLAAYVALCLLAQAQLLITDYVLHYGMRRAPRGDGWAPVGPEHSWNAPHAVTNLLTLHAPRHSDHHAHPGRGFEDLRLEAGLPMLPASLPAMVTLALVPALWRRVMHPRLDALAGVAQDGPDPHPAGDLRCAS